MDTTSSRNGSLLVPAVAVVAVIALIIGIIGLVKVNKLGKQLGAVSVADLAARVDTIDATAKKASDDAGRATTRVTGLSTDTQRAFDQVGSELATMRTSLNKLTTDAEALSARLASGPARAAASSAASGGGSGPTPGTVDEDGTYVVKGGDTLAKIGATVGVAWQEIVKANPGINPNRLQVGQKIVIPKR